MAIIDVTNLAEATLVYATNIMVDYVGGSKPMNDAELADWIKANDGYLSVTEIRLVTLANLVMLENE